MTIILKYWKFNIGLHFLLLCYDCLSIVFYTDKRATLALSEEEVMLTSTAEPPHEMLNEIAGGAF